MSPDRIGNFTSSDIYRLMSNGKAAGSFGAPFYEYIEEKRMERRLHRSLTADVDARATSWGKLVEKRCFDVLPIDYTLCSDVTLSHPEISYWKGTPDAVTTEAVADVKSPSTLKSFCQLVDPYYDKTGKLLHEGLTIEAVRENNKDGDKFFWQIVSNAILTGKNKGELIVYAPYQEELPDIRMLADGKPEYYWIWSASDDQLPYLIYGGAYKNCNVIRFDILQRDKDALTERVLEAGKLLNKRP